VAPNIFSKNIQSLSFRRKICVISHALSRKCRGTKSSWVLPELWVHTIMSLFWRLECRGGS